MMAAPRTTPATTRSDNTLPSPTLAIPRRTGSCPAHDQRSAAVIAAFARVKQDD
jgi:hypothetical protein